MALEKSDLSGPDEDDENVSLSKTKRGHKTTSTVRSAKQVIHQAITENKFSEPLLYGFAIAFVSCGMISLLVGVIREEGTVRAIASISRLMAMR